MNWDQLTGKSQRYQDLTVNSYRLYLKKVLNTTKKSPGWILYRTKLWKLWVASWLTARLSTATITGKTACPGDVSSLPCKDTPGPGIKDKTSTQSQDYHISGIFSPTCVSWWPTKPEVSEPTIARKYYPNPPNECALDSFVFCTFRHPISGDYISDFGAVLDKYEDRYMIKLNKSQNTIVVPVALLWPAGQA